MVSTIKNILVPLDGSNNSFRGLDKAISVAKASDAKITGLYVFQLPMAAGIKLTNAMKNKARDKGARALGIAKQRVEKNGLNFSYKTAGGKPGDAIVNTAIGARADMIVIGARGLGAAKEKFLGSTSNHVMHKSRLPVLVVK